MEFVVVRRCTTTNKKRHESSTVIGAASFAIRQSKAILVRSCEAKRLFASREIFTVCAVDRARAIVSLNATSHTVPTKFSGNKVHSRLSYLLSSLAVSLEENAGAG